MNDLCNQLTSDYDVSILDNYPPVINEMMKVVLQDTKKEEKKFNKTLYDHLHNFYYRRIKI